LEERRVIVKSNYDTGRKNGCKESKNSPKKQGNDEWGKKEKEKGRRKKTERFESAQGRGSFAQGMKRDGK